MRKNIQFEVEIQKFVYVLASVEHWHAPLMMMKGWIHIPFWTSLFCSRSFILKGLPLMRCAPHCCVDAKKRIRRFRACWPFAPFVSTGLNNRKHRLKLLLRKQSDL